MPFPQYRIPGKTLISTLIICVLIATVLSIYQMSVNAQQGTLLRSESRYLSFLSLQSGMNYFQSVCRDMTGSRLTADTTMYLNGRTLYARINRWGLFHTIHASLESRHDTLHASALVGCKTPASLENTALVLEDSEHIVRITGHSAIDAVCYLPKGKIERRDFINLNPESKETLYARIKDRESFSAPKETDHRQYGDLYSFSGILENPEFDLVRFHDLEHTSLHRSFTERTLVIYSEGTMEMSGYRISGNVILLSGKNILIAENDSLCDVLVVAPHIHFSERSGGIVHLFASDSITVSDQCRFEYPSSIILHASERSKLVFGEECSFSGSVLVYADGNLRYSPLVSFGKSISFSGDVYSRFPVFISGTVNGYIRAPSIGRRSAKIQTHTLYDLQLKSDDLIRQISHGAIYDESTSIAKKLG